MLQMQLFSTTHPEEREQILRDNSEGVELDFAYTRILTEEELSMRREIKVNNDITLAKMQEELKEYIARAKEEMKPFGLQNSSLIAAVRDRVERTTATVYKFKDEETRQMGYYNAAGELVFSRMLTPEERQGSLLSGTMVMGK